MRILFSAALFFLTLTWQTASAQGVEVPFGGLEHDASQAIEIAADQLQIDQADGTAQFVGNVVIGQGDMRMMAGRVQVFYRSESSDSATGAVDRLIATEGVTLTSGAEAAEAEQAEFLVSESVILMSGDVILTQGRNAIAAETLRIDMTTGTAFLDGRVRTIFQPSSN